MVLKLCMCWWISAICDVMTTRTKYMTWVVDYVRRDVVHGRVRVSKLLVGESCIWHDFLVTNWMIRNGYLVSGRKINTALLH